MSCRASSYIPSRHKRRSVEGTTCSILAGQNGGGNHARRFRWPLFGQGIEIIRDIYTQASQGVVLTWVALWDAEVAFRAEAYQRLAFKIDLTGGGIDHFADHTGASADRYRRGPECGHRGGKPNKPDSPSRPGHGAVVQFIRQRRASIW